MTSRSRKYFKKVDLLQMETGEFLFLMAKLVGGDKPLPPIPRKAPNGMTIGEYEKQLTQSITATNWITGEPMEVRRATISEDGRSIVVTIR